VTPIPTSTLAPLPPMAESVAGRPSTALLVGAREWAMLALQQQFEDAGWATLRATTSARALALCLEANPDLVVVEAGLAGVGSASPPEPALTLARALRNGGGLAPAAPLLLVTTDATARPLRLAALGAGAWDVVTLPCDPALLLARCAAWTAGKRAADRASQAALLEPHGELYSPRGLVRRAVELGAEAARRRQPLACLRLRLEAPAASGPRRVGDSPPVEPAERAELQEAAVADAVRAVRDLHGRAADVFGRLSATEFAVLAPGTDVAGAEQLGARLAAHLEERLAALAPLADARLYLAVRSVLPGANTQGRWDATDATALVTGPWPAHGAADARRPFVPRIVG
jgi:DNA-binding response OmpR family regulator